MGGGAVSKLRPHDLLTPKERQQRAKLREEMDGYDVTLHEPSPAERAKFVKVVEKWHIGPDGNVDEHTVEPEPESPPTQPEGAPLPVPEENCRQLAYQGRQDPRTCPEAVACPFCGRPALQTKVMGVKVIGCKCIPRDTAYALNLDMMRRK